MTSSFQMFEIYHRGIFSSQGPHCVVFALLLIPKLPDKICGRFGFLDVLAVEERLSCSVNHLHEMHSVRDLVQHQLFPANEINE